MKIALCFSGQARSFLKGYEYYKKNLLDLYDVDVFIHSWKTKHDNHILDLYQPRSYEFEDPLNGNYDQVYINTPDIVRHPPRFTVSMLYSVYKSSLLRQRFENNTSTLYKWVIKSRTDYALNLVIPFHALSPDKLYIPNCITVPERDFGNDQFAFGGPNVMDKRMSIYLNMDRFYQEGCMMIGEHMLRKQLQLHNLVGDNLNYINMNNPFPPGQYNSTPHSLIRDDISEWK